MKTLNRVVVVRWNRHDHVRHYPVFEYSTIQEAIAAHGEAYVLDCFNHSQAEAARTQERAALIHAARSGELVEPQ